MSKKEPHADICQCLECSIKRGEHIDDPATCKCPTCIINRVNAAVVEVNDGR